MPLWAEGIGAFALLCATSLFAITNPLSAAPVYLALTDGYTPEHRRQTLRTAMLTAASVLVLFALLGGTIFQIFGITINAFRIAGGIIVFAIGMDMLQAKRSRGKATKEEQAAAMKQDEVAISPLGIPMIVGPGAITTVMVLMTEAVTIAHIVTLFVAIAVVLGSIYAALSAGPRLVSFFGQTGLNVITRVMGLLVAVIGVQFVIDGVSPIIVDVLNAAFRM
jgi:multiple antibiotic resistance protein